MSTLYEQNLQREIKLMHERDLIDNEYDYKQHIGSPDSRKKAQTMRNEFLTAFNAEHKVFSALKSNATATQSDYERHFRRAEAILKEHIRKYSDQFNGGVNAFYLTQAEAVKYREETKRKLNALRQEIREYHQILLRYSHSEYFYHNADSVLRDIDKELEDIEHKFYWVKSTDTRGYSEYVNTIQSHYVALAYRFRSIKSGAPFYLFRK